MRIVNEATALGMTIAWSDEEEYQLGTKFLLQIGAIRRRSDGAVDDEPACYYLQTKQQYEALLAFRRALREERKSAYDRDARRSSEAKS